MRKMFIENLPRRQGRGGKEIDWKNTIGYKVKFVYDDAIKLWRVQLTDNSGNYISEIGAINFDPNENTLK